MRLPQDMAVSIKNGRDRITACYLFRFANNGMLPGLSLSLYKSTSGAETGVKLNTIQAVSGLYPVVLRKYYIMPLFISSDVSLTSKS